MIIDTDVLIWATRGNAKALAVIEAEPARKISVASVMELMQGARSKTELKAIELSFRQPHFQILSITPEICNRAMRIMEQHALSVRLQVVDAFLAATAIEHTDLLLTGNVKPFRPIKGLQLRVFRA